MRLQAALQAQLDSLAVETAELRKSRERADELGCRSGVLTFAPHPRRYFAGPETKPFLLTRGVDERAEHEASEDAYRQKRHERALLVERYRTMMRQLRDNRRFVEEERAKRMEAENMLASFQSGK